VRELREETRLLIAMSRVTLGELESHEHQLRNYLTDESGRPQEKRQ
jgi:hypothetical protein